MSLFDLTGEVAIITGSTKGIGKASAFSLAEHGAKVVISSRKQDAGDAVAAEIDARFGAGTAIAIAANISDKAALQHLVDETRAAFGRIGVPQEIAGAVVFFAAPASAFMTGQSIVIDGGVTI